MNYMKITKCLSKVLGDNELPELFQCALCINLKRCFSLRGQMDTTHASKIPPQSFISPICVLYTVIF